MTSTLESPFCLQGRSAIITGGSKGLGAVAAEALANAGARVLLVARSRSALEERADSLTASGGEAAWISADLSQRGAAEVIVQSAIESFGRIDVLVNSAGAITAALCKTQPKRNTNESCAPMSSGSGPCVVRRLST